MCCPLSKGKEKKKKKKKELAKLLLQYSSHKVLQEDVKPKQRAAAAVNSGSSMRYIMFTGMYRPLQASFNKQSSKV